MSMISEFVKELREKSALFSKSDFAVAGIAKDYKEAADIIEELSAKLASANMGRSEQYYKGNSEFVEKLIEQIRKKKEYHKDFYEKMGCTEHDKDLHKATQLAFDECMEIVEELSKEYKSDGWIPVSEHYPDTGKYILLSFSNFSTPVVGRWEEDENGGAFYVGDEQDSCVSQDLYVNAWQPLPQPYKGE